MVDWKPVTGVIPPLNDAEWIAEFEKYKAFPEYQKVNRDMTVEEFKTIFYFEYGHRVLGRFIGLLFLLPFLFFWFSKRISKELAPKLITMFILGGLQGLLGWYMVKSGLVNEPRVSQYRLTAHLGAAVLIYGYILWVAFDLLYPQPSNACSKKTARFSYAVTALVFLMILSGGLVAGTRAGYAYNTFPLMAGQLIPEGLFALQPWWLNVFENIIAIQFNHRILAYIIIALTTALLIKLYRNKPAHLSVTALHSLTAVLALQVLLGITTLVLIVPVSLGVAHQGGAVLLFSIALFVSHQLKSKQPN